jgi:hypothetical protein
MSRAGPLSASAAFGWADGRFGDARQADMGATCVRMRRPSRRKIVARKVALRSPVLLRINWINWIDFRAGASATRPSVVGALGEMRVTPGAVSIPGLDGRRRLVEVRSSAAGSGQVHEALVH